MKSLLIVSAFLLVAFLHFDSYAQAGMEDVVYLNNGSVLRGIIIEQVPNKSLKVQIAGGSIFHVEIGDVTRIAKEPTVVVPEVLRERPRDKSTAAAPRDTVQRAPYEPKRRGYFFQAQILLEIVQGGAHIINGYRFGRFGHLGLGIGLDLSGPSPANGFSDQVNGGNYAATGTYLPIFLHYSGEILKKRVTPFYAVEVGYAAALWSSGMNDYGNGPTDLRGGAMWGLGIGVRFKTKKRLNFSLLLNVNAKNVSYREYSYWYDSLDQNYYAQSQRVRTTMVYPGLRFGIGF
ncbi:MAG: hypothetical protein K9J06_09500 [Flavobacteriales bacterium]|nr:hypothetical protein [Flavobacteriales bacterium]